MSDTILENSWTYSGEYPLKKSGLDSSFQYEENNSRVTETLEEYMLDYAEEAYENPGEQAPRGIMALGGEIQVSENTSTWMDYKHS